MGTPSPEYLYRRIIFLFPKNHPNRIAAYFNDCVMSHVKKTDLDNLFKTMFGVYQQKDFGVSDRLNGEKLNLGKRLIQKFPNLFCRLLEFLSRGIFSVPKHPGGSFGSRNDMIMNMHYFLTCLHTIVQDHIVIHTSKR